MNIDEIINQYHHFATEATKRENKIAFVDQMRTILQAYDAEEISLSKVCELINCAHIAKRNEFADQEKEKVAVAFAEWTNDACMQYFPKLYRIKDLSNSPDYCISNLYQYFIENIYNQ